VTDETPLSIHAPEGEAKAGIVVVQEAFGVNGHIEAVAARLADAGWYAVAPHLFHRSGDPQLPYDDISQVFPHMQALTREGVLADVDAALAELDAAGLPPARCGIVGFCMGGSVAFHVATERDIGAAVSYYGGGVAEGRFGFPSQIDGAPRLRVPWLGLFGDRDESIPVEQVERLRAAAASTSAPTEVVRYPDAAHGFNCDERPSYSPDAAADAWRRMLDWFDRHLSAG
jgi:carboxymethylenebutenolidase